MTNLTLTKVKLTDIEKEGVPQLQLTPLNMPSEKRKMGTLKGNISVRDNFDQLFDSEISEMFNR